MVCFDRGFRLLDLSWDAFILKRLKIFKHS